MEDYYVVYAYEGGIAAVATLATLSIPDLAAGIDASTDINTIVTRLGEIKAGIDGLPTSSLSQSQITAAINGSVDIDSLIARLTEIRDGALTQSQVANAIDAALDINSIIASLGTISGNLITQTQVANAIDAAVDINSIITSLNSIVSGLITQSQVTAAINGAVDIDTLITQITSAASSATAINGKLPALESGRVPISDPVTSYSLGETLTAAIGTSWTALASGATRNITVRNRTGTNIDIRKVGETTVLTMATGDDLPLPVLTNSNEWEIRRTDAGNTQVTVRFLRWA